MPMRMAETRGGMEDSFPQRGGDRKKRSRRGKPTSVGGGTRVMGSIIKAAGEDASKKWEKVWQASRMPTGVADPQICLHGRNRGHDVAPASLAVKRHDAVGQG